MTWYRNEIREFCSQAWQLLELYNMPQEVALVVQHSPFSVQDFLWVQEVQVTWVSQVAATFFLWDRPFDFLCLVWQWMSLHLLPFVAKAIVPWWTPGIGSHPRKLCWVLNGCDEVGTVGWLISQEMDLRYGEVQKCRWSVDALYHFAPSCIRRIGYLFGVSSLTPVLSSWNTMMFLQ